MADIDTWTGITYADEGNKLYITRINQYEFNVQFDKSGIARLTLGINNARVLGNALIAAADAAKGKK